MRWLPPGASDRRKFPWRVSPIPPRPGTPPFLLRRLSEGSMVEGRPPGIATHPTRDSRRFFLFQVISETGSAGRGRAHFGGVDAETEMREVGLSQGHEAGIEITPHEKKQEGHRGIVFVEDGVEHGKGKIKAEKNLRVGHPAGLVPVRLRDRSE